LIFWDFWGFFGIFSKKSEGVRGFFRVDNPSESISARLSVLFQAVFKFNNDLYNILKGEKALLQTTKNCKKKLLIITGGIS
jgi:hypothetical protein